MLENMGTIKKFKDGKVIFHENVPGKEMYVIESGKVKLTRTNMREAENVVATLAVLNPKEFFGEMALFDCCSRSATATAVGDVEVRIINQNDLEKKIEEHPETAFYFLNKLSRRIRKTDELTELLLVREKLAKDLYDKINALRYPEFL